MERPKMFENIEYGRRNQKEHVGRKGHEVT
jgi:hypothetical protein